jgi:hypothetical protein
MSNESAKSNDDESGYDEEHPSGYTNSQALGAPEPDLG